MTVKIKCKYCKAKIGVKALEYEYRSYKEDNPPYEVTITKCPICGSILKEEREYLDEDERVDTSECEWTDGGGIVVNLEDDS